MPGVAGQPVYVRCASSYYESLVGPNARLVKFRRPPVDIRLREDTPLALAVRPDSPQLLALVGRFQKATGRGTLWGNMKVREYFATGSFIRNPGNARDPRVGIPDIGKLDRNIEAGTKYLRFVIDHYYEDEPMTAVDKELRRAVAVALWAASRSDPFSAATM